MDTHFNAMIFKSILTLKQSLCCDDGTTMGKCQWRGYRGVGLSCTSGCVDGETKIVENTNNHGKKDQTCNGGLQSYCCAGFKSAPTKAQLEKQAADAAKAAAEAKAANAALDLAAKAFCRVAVPALLAPLELLEDAIPIIGEIADLVEIAATPAIIKACEKGVEKEGKAEFKVFGKKHTLDINKPTDTPANPRPPPKSHEPPKTKSKASKTKDHQSTTARHSTTSSATTSATSEPYRCMKNKCGESCALKRSIPGGESSDSALDRRAFSAVNNDGDVEKMKNKKGNRDISTFKNRATDWIPFDGSNPKSVTIVGLEGCTVIAAMFEKGMIASHIFEDGEGDDTLDKLDTLNALNYGVTLAAVQADIKKKLPADLGDLKNSQLLVMMPKSPTQPSKWLYDTVHWSKLDDNGKISKKKYNIRNDMIPAITNMAKEATGLTDANVVSYNPPKDAAQAKLWDGTTHGTFAMQYDPKYSDGEQARQIWCEGVPAWPQNIVWPLG